MKNEKAKICKHFNKSASGYHFKGNGKSELLGSAWVSDWFVCPICAEIIPKVKEENK